MESGDDRKHVGIQDGKGQEQMKIRNAGLEDLPEILKLYEEARAFMQETGNETQWGTSYPPVERVEADIREGKSYVCEADDVLAGVFYFSEGPDPDYAEIYEGSWIGTGAYHVMHRVAAPGRVKGAGSFCIRWCAEHGQGDLRIDTHRNNLPMQHVLGKLGFETCGIIHLADGDERIAFEICT